MDFARTGGFEDPPDSSGTREVVFPVARPGEIEVRRLAHEIRNALTVVVANLEVASADPAVEGRFGEMPTLILESLDAARHIASLLHEATSPQGTGTARPRTALGEAVTSAVAALPASVPIDVSCDFDGVVPLSRCQARTLVTNLLLNAIDAVAESERSPLVRVTVHGRGESVVLRVEDSGPGVPATLRERVFELGYSTKGADGGIGLDVCRAVAESAGGSIDVLDSDVGGACFRVELPWDRGLDVAHVERPEKG